MKSLFFSLLFVAAGAFAQGTVDDAKKLIDARRYDEARTALDAIVSRDPSDGYAHYLFGSLLGNQFREYDAAEEQLEKSVALVPDNADYHFTLGRLYGVQAQRASIFSKLSYAGKVKAEFLRAVELAPDIPSYRVGLINFYLMAPGIAGGSVAKAKDHAAELLKRNASAGYLASGQIAAYEKDYESAEREYLAAIQADPTRSSPYNLLGYLYITLKRPDEAIAQFTQYATRFPKDPNSYDSLGDGYTAKGDIDSALANYLKALSMNPAYPPSLFGAARSYDAKGEKTNALAYYKKYLEGTQEGTNAETAQDRLKELSR